MIVFSKAINSMWILINTNQFLAYQSMWQFNYSSFCRFILEEIKRISLGEYVDKAEIGNKIRKIFGLKE